MKKNIFKKVLAGVAAFAMVATMMPAMTAQAAARAYTITLPDDTDALTYELVSVSPGKIVERIEGTNSWKVEDSNEDPSTIRFSITRDEGYDWSTGESDSGHAATDLTVTGAGTLDTDHTVSLSETNFTSIVTVKESAKAKINGTTLEVTTSKFGTVLREDAIVVFTAPGEWNADKTDATGTTGVNITPKNSYSIEWRGTEGVSGAKTLTPMTATMDEVSKVTPTGTMVKGTGYAEFTLKAGAGATVKDAKVSYTQYNDKLVKLDGGNTTSNAGGTGTNDTVAVADYAITATTGADGETVYRIPKSRINSATKYIMINVQGVAAFTNPKVQWEENTDLYTFKKMTEGVKNDETRHAPGTEINFELELNKNTIKTDRFKVYITTKCNGKDYRGDFDGGSSNAYSFKIPENIDTSAPDENPVVIHIEGLKNSEDYDVVFPAKQTLANMGFDVDNTDGDDMGYTLNIQDGVSNCVEDWVDPEDLDDSVKSYDQLLVVYDKDESEEINITVTYDDRNAYEDEEVKLTYAGEDVELKRTVAGHTVTFVGRFTPKKSGEVVFSGLKEYVTVRLDSNAGVRITATDATLEKAISIGAKDELGNAISFKMKQDEEVTVNMEAKEGYTLPSNLILQANDGGSNILSNVNLTKNSDGTWTFKTFFVDVDAGDEGDVTKRINAVFPKEDINPANNARFTDVQNAASYYYDAVYDLADRDIVRGMTDTLFGVGQDVQRGQVVTFLYRHAGEPEVTGTNDFSDVAEDQYYTDAVNWAVEQGIAKGYEDGTFKPAQAVTRAEASAFLCRYAKGEAGTSNSFTDVASTDWFFGDVSWAAGNGVVNGIGDNMFAPRDNCKREQFVTILYRAGQSGVIK